MTPRSTSAFVFTTSSPLRASEPTVQTSPASVRPLPPARARVDSVSTGSQFHSQTNVCTRSQKNGHAECPRENGEPPLKKHCHGNTHSDDTAGTGVTHDEIQKSPATLLRDIGAGEPQFDRFVKPLIPSVNPTTTDDTDDDRISVSSSHSAFAAVPPVRRCDVVPPSKLLGDAAGAQLSQRCGIGFQGLKRLQNELDNLYAAGAPLLKKRCLTSEKRVPEITAHKTRNQDSLQRVSPSGSPRARRVASA